MGAAGGGFSPDAFKRVPPAARRPYIWLAAIWASYCGGLHGFNTANISGAMQMSQWDQDFGWKGLASTTISNYEGWAVSSMLLGQTVGVFLAGPLGDRRGRKSVILASAICYVIGAILMAANLGSFAELLVGRVLSGLGSGMGMSAGPIYISEVAPLELRGMMTTFYNVNIMSGVAGSYWINYASPQVLPSTSSWQWRTTLVLQSIPAIILLLGFPFFPESPRYLMMRGRIDAAHRSLSRLRGGLDESTEYFAREYTELRSRLDTTSTSGTQAFLSLLRECIHHAPTRKVLLFVTLIQTFFIMSGGNSITYYAPDILDSIGLSHSQVLLFTAIYGLIKFFAVLLYAFFLTDRYGRRPLLLLGSTINVLCLLYLTCYLALNPPSSSTSPSAASWVSIVAICIYAIGYGFGWAPAFSLTASEICPTRIRGTVVTLAFTYQNLLNFGITRAFPNMTDSMHTWGPFALFTAFTAVGTVWVGVAFPECKGKSMEGMEEVFSRPWWRVGWDGPATTGNEQRVEDTEVEKGTSTHEEIIHK
ncbi:sugar transporter [Aspergillus sclerotioniger CBS 115572]|uniref:Sugar transporter n=1 Tax=Aspergillus sclerotioniger CBS 115572 TaxID=1450535 RepID=A0A317VLR7_9EURO|nr:sugar transporter [Aspergillus sclerotioniger CBS 115572]PWY74509.1 sugar transporter [Aspergillus sclerotioniger CBS 115572]